MKQIVLAKAETGKSN